MPDHTVAARRLFAAFATRHALTWEEEPDAPVEVLWRFPAQPGLRHPVVLMLQNEDELHFGVGELQAGLFPFEKVREDFNAILDEWVQGRARVAPAFLGARLERFEAGRWRTVYRQWSPFMPSCWQGEVLMNAPAPDVPRALREGR